MRTSFQVKVPAFDGSFVCTVEKEEWKAFVETLRHLETSVGRDAETSWGNMEENIELQFRLYKCGTLEGQYKFSPNNFSLGPTLSGAFEADQTFLAGWVSSAQQVLDRFRQQAREAQL